MYYMHKIYNLQHCKYNEKMNINSQKHYTVVNKTQMAKIATYIVNQLQVDACNLILLKGDLGTGKTYLAQLLINNLAGKATQINSPSYDLVRTYDFQGAKVSHLDLYRLKSQEELLNLGIDDILHSCSCVIIEWPEVAMDHLSHYSRIEVSLIHKNSDSRMLSVDKYL